MALLLVLLATLGPVQACAPTAAPNNQPNQPIPPSNSSGKREVEQVQVTVVTNQKYDPSMNDAHLHTLRALLSDYSKTKGVVYDRDLVQEIVRNVDQSFAVVYTVLGSDCDEVNNFAHGAKSEASFITRMTIKCGGRPEFVIN